jgi:hypothetical protein
LVLLVDYCRYWVSAPCWCEQPELEELRVEVKRIRNVTELRWWLKSALEIAIDPL